jgi:hypothetical protein
VAAEREAQWRRKEAEAEREYAIEEAEARRERRASNSMKLTDDGERTMTTYEHWSDDPVALAKYERESEERDRRYGEVHQRIAAVLHNMDRLKAQAQLDLERVLKSSAYASDVFARFCRAYRTRRNGVVTSADWEDFTGRRCLPPPPAPTRLRLVVNNQPKAPAPKITPRWRPPARRDDDDGPRAA